MLWLDVIALRQMVTLPDRNKALWFYSCAIQRQIHHDNNRICRLPSTQSDPDGRQPIGYQHPASAGCRHGA